LAAYDLTAPSLSGGTARFMSNTGVPAGATVTLEIIGVGW
jgi:hypothetical protein